MSSLVWRSLARGVTRVSSPVLLRAQKGSISPSTVVQRRSLAGFAGRIGKKGPGGIDLSEFMDPFEGDPENSVSFTPEEVLEEMHRIDEAKRKANLERLKAWRPSSEVLKEEEEEMRKHVEATLQNLCVMPRELANFEIEWDFSFYPPYKGPEDYRLLEQPLKKAAATFCVDDLHLNEAQVEFFKKLVGPRYMPKTRTVRIVCDHHDNLKDNMESLKQILVNLVNEVRNYDANN